MELDRVIGWIRLIEIAGILLLLVVLAMVSSRVLAEDGVSGDTFAGETSIEFPLSHSR